MPPATTPTARATSRAGASRPARLRRSAGALCAAALLTAGCTGLEPAVIGAAVGGVQTGVTLLSGTRLWSYEYAGFDDVVDATIVVTDQLHLERINENAESDDRYWSAYRYGPKRRYLEIEIHRETDVVTSIRIDTGRKAQRGMSALLLRQVFAELRARGAYPQSEAELRSNDTDLSP